jgi:hypothetical protein
MASSSCSTCGIATFLNTEMKQQKERISSQTSFLSHFYIFRKCNISIYTTNVISGFMLVPKLLVFNVRTTHITHNSMLLFHHIGCINRNITFTENEKMAQKGCLGRNAFFLLFHFCIEKCSYATSGAGTMLLFRILR